MNTISVPTELPFPHEGVGTSKDAPPCLSDGDSAVEVHGMEKAGWGTGAGRGTGGAQCTIENWKGGWD